MPGNDDLAANTVSVRALTLLAVALGLGAVAFAMTAQFLGLWVLPETPANDLAMHTAMVDGVLDAFRSGQWLPRLLSAPGHVPDIPVFQYYGLATGMLGIPGALFGLPAFPALMIGLLVARGIGLWGVYASARLLGGGRPVAMLAATVYGLTPYLISNLYGRIDIAESLAHCELPFLVLGLLLAQSRSVATGAAVIAGTIFCLALTHPIFLLYGALGLGGMALVGGSGRSWAAVVAGGVIGLLLSAFQWYPAMVGDDLLSGHFLKYSPFHAAILTSASGLYGPPLSMADRGWTSPEAAYVFHTPGWLTLPMLAVLIFWLSRTGNPPERRRWARVVLASGAVFLFLSYSPIDVFQFLPKQTWALQMPYRLLAFSALFTALALPLVAPSLGLGPCFLLFMVTVAQSAPLLLHPTYQKPLAVPASTYASIDYLMRDRRGLTTPDGWLVHYAVPLYPRPPSRDDKPGSQVKANSNDDLALVDSEGWLRLDNRWAIRRIDGQPSMIRIEGVSSLPNTSTRLWLAAADRPEWPLTPQIPIAPGRVAVAFDLPSGEGPFRLVTDPPLPPPLVIGNDGARQGLHLTAIEGRPGRVLHRPPAPMPGVLHVVGHTRLTDEPTMLWLATPNAPDQALTTRVAVGPGAFDAVIPLPDAEGDYVLVPSRFEVPAQRDPESTDQRRLSVLLESVEIDALSASGMPIAPTVIPETAVNRSVIGAYDRRYRIDISMWLQSGGHWHGGYGALQMPVPVTLPLAFNPFFQLIQAGHPLAAQPDRAGRAVISTSDLVDPIEAHYRLPLFCWLAVTLGVVMLAGLWRFERAMGEHLKISDDH